MNVLVISKKFLVPVKSLTGGVGEVKPNHSAFTDKLINTHFSCAHLTTMSTLEGGRSVVSKGHHFWSIWNSPI